MLLEALEMLQNSGGNEDTFVTDFGVYKVLRILTVYLPFFVATFLLSQEYLGEKIACFAPENFTGSHEGALGEYCWNDGFWVAEGVPLEKSLLTQPHRYYPLLLPLQAVIFLCPVIFWNIMTKSRLLAILRGSERFLDDLLGLVNSKGEVDEKRLGRQAVLLIKQYHYTCVTAATDTMLGYITFIRISFDVVLSVAALAVQMYIYDTREKEYQCHLTHLWPKPIMCTVPILDLLDIVWSVTVGSLLLTCGINLFLLYTFYKLYHDKYQPLFYNNLPYGDYDDFNENVEWEDRWIKVSYRLLFDMFQENNPIMTRVYSLYALQPEDRKLRWQQRLARKRQRREARQLNNSLNPVLNIADCSNQNLFKLAKDYTYEGFGDKKCDFVQDLSVETPSSTKEVPKVARKFSKRRPGRSERRETVGYGPSRLDYLILSVLGVLMALAFKKLFTE